MARENYTSLTVWLSMPLADLRLWIETHNEIVKEDRKKVEEMRQKRKRG